MPTKSRLTLARAAIRPSMWGRMLLTGPSGAGKTWTGLVIAETLVHPNGKILVIDTEKESALTYADKFRFDHLPWKAPFDPRELADTLLDPQNPYDCILIDSFTHFWRGSGGTLDIANGKFTGWKDARPAQVDVTEAILEADCHVIACIRQTMEHAQIAKAGGGFEVVKLGLAPEQDKDFEYEVNVSIEIDMQHTLQISKSRTADVPVGRTFHAGHAADFATLYRDWLKGGEPVADKADVDALVASLDSIADRGERVKSKAMFLDCFGRPEFLLVSRMPEAIEWVAAQVEAANGGAVTGSATEGADVAPGPEEPDEAPVGPSPVPDAPATSEAPAAPASAATPESGPATDDPAAARREKFEATVKAYSLSQVRKQLEAVPLKVEGTPVQLRARLVDHLLGQAENVAASA